MATKSVALYRRVYVWEFPVRAYHWINAITVLVLIVTGYIIGRPVSFGASAEAYQQYWFGWARFLHFLTAFIFFFNFLARIYWGFVGNQYARWQNFIPTTRAQWNEILEVLRVDILQTRLRGSSISGTTRWPGCCTSPRSWSSSSRRSPDSRSTPA